MEEDAAPSGAAVNCSERNALKRRSNAKWMEVRRAAELAKELGAKAVTLHGITMWLPKQCEHVKTSRCRASAAKRGGARSSEGGRVHRKQDAAQDRLEPAAEEQVQAVEPPVCAKLSKAKQRSRERLLEFQQKAKRSLKPRFARLPRSARRCCSSRFCQQRTLGRLSGRAPTLIASAKQVQRTLPQ